MPRSAAYGSDHQARRKLAIEEAYNTPCPRCGNLMLKGQNLDFGHSEDVALNPGAKADRIEHADWRDCPAGGNRAAGGRLAHEIQDLRPSRQW